MGGLPKTIDADLSDPVIFLPDTLLLQSFMEQGKPC
jgi:hypothetical protein